MILSALILGLLAATAYSEPTVFTHTGKIVGHHATAYQTDKPYYAFYGIPFAEPPVGDLRFEPPVPFVSRTCGEQINSDTYRDGCPQLNSPSSEDCLYLNVFTPISNCGDFDTEAGKKVVVYFHGGGFDAGAASSYPASNWVTDYDVILVVVEYRVGAMGFLSSGDDKLPGNYGLLDQIMALHWVKDNIALFGGDPDDVTLYGTSAGAVSANILSLSPLCKGLFNKVIMDGGFALAPWAIDQNPLEILYLLADRVGCLPDDDSVRNGSRKYHRLIVRCLKQVDADVIVSTLAAEIEMSHDDVLSMEAYTSFGPVVDGVVIEKDPFELLADPAYLEEVGALDRKYLIGVANNEALQYGVAALNLGIVPLEALVNPYHQVAQEIILNNYLSVFSGPITQEILDITSFLYYYPRDINGVSDIQSSIDFMSDVDFVIPGVMLARALTNASSDVDVFFYVLDHYPETIPNFPFQGCTHGLSLVFSFDTNTPLAAFMTTYFDITDEVHKPVFDAMRGMLSNFAKYDDPSVPGIFQMPRYDLDNESYLSVSTQPEVRSHLFRSRVSMWTDFLPNTLGAVYTRGKGRAPFRL